MRAVVAAAASLLAFAPLARADVVTTIGASLDARATGASFGATADSPVTDFLGGARLTMSFEAAPLPVPPPTLYVHDLQLAPELLAGALSDDKHGEGYVGAGARIDVRMSSMRNDRLWRGALYVAARGMVIGAHHDGAVEIALGSYLTTERGTRVGWESAAILRPLHDAPADASKELDALFTLYVGR